MFENFCDLTNLSINASLKVYIFYVTKKILSNFNFDQML